MAGLTQGGPNMDQFEAFFQRADLDRDGRISGAEAVGFFQGSNLPKQVLAQIWTYADQRRTGFLGRAEFYNALKLVTVAQSKRELTPDIVKAALYGPASAKIPAPQINLAAVQVPQSNSAPAPVAQMGRGVAPQQMNLAATTPQMGQAAPPGSQNVGFRGQVPQNANLGFGGQAPPNAGLGYGGQAPPTANLGFGGQAHSASTMNQNYFSSQGNPSVRSPLPQSAGGAVRPQHGVPTSDFSTRGTVASSAPVGINWAGGQISGVSTGISHSSNQGINTSTSSAGSKSLDSYLSTSLPASTGSKASVGSGSGNGFTSDPVFGGTTFSATPSSASNPALSSAIVPVSSGPPSSTTPDLFSSLQSGFTRQPAGNQQLTQPPSTANQHVSTQNTSLLTSSGPSVGQVNSNSNQAQIPWPKMTPAGIQKYTKVFIEVDSDRDGKITGDQARNLFMSWRLPREVLKQVWDLSDQDNDSMLSLREFCVALYLMERFREGRPLPPTLPSHILLDETLLSLTGQSTASYGNAAWGHTAGFRPQQGMPGVRPMGPAAGLRPPVPGRVPQADGAAHADQQRERASSAGSSHANQLSNGEQILSDTNSQGSAEPEKKVDEKIILDSKEKLEFYRTKMQDLVLYKSRCDNRLNEITERALADKREAELLGKKYEEKYKQVAETASKLTIEEAGFREIQERKIELQQAITKMEQGGSADGILQVRADRIQSELEELMRALTERCKKHGIDIKPAALIELPTGWQPGIPEKSSVWDEDWDKFDDEGLQFGMSLPPQTNPTSPNDNLAPDLMSHDDEISETSFIRDERPFEVESAYGHSEDESGKSPSGSPAGRSAFENPSREYSSDHFRKSPEADTESQRNFDEPGWGSFDNNDDDIDSVWGFNNSKGSDHDKYGEKHFFDSSEFGDSPRRSDSPNADTTFPKKSLFFEDSVPSTPLSRAGSSPPSYSFDNMSRFDSFSTRDDTFASRRETFSRFDSMNSNAGFDRGQGHARFDSISSSSGFDHRQGFSSFDDNDPFGSSGPFKVSSENQTPKKGSEPWSSF